MHRRSMIAAASLLLALCGPSEGPESPPADLREGRPAWQVATWKFLASDDCVGAIEYLKRHPLPQQPMWYVLYSQADFLCWQNHMGDPFRKHGLEILDEGIKVLPYSPRLLKSKAEGYEVLGDASAAHYYFEAARRRAESNLSSDNRATHSEDEEVLNEILLSSKR